jgi:hypothetical protein
LPRPPNNVVLLRRGVAIEPFPCANKRVNMFFLIRSVIGGGGVRGYAVAQLVEASILFGRIMAQGSTQPLAEMNTRDFPWEVKATGGWG